MSQEQKQGRGKAGTKIEKGNKENQENLSSPHLLRCGLFWVVWTSKSYDFDSAQKHQFLTCSEKDNCKAIIYHRGYSLLF